MKKKVLSLIFSGAILLQLLLPNIAASANTNQYDTNKIIQEISSKIGNSSSYTTPIISQKLRNPKDFIYSNEIKLILKVTNVNSKNSNCKWVANQVTKIISILMNRLSISSSYSEKNISTLNNDTNLHPIDKIPTNISNQVKITHNNVTQNTKLSINEIESLIKEIGSSIKNHPLRQEYENAVKNLSNYEVKLRNKGLNEKEIAQAMHQSRRNLGIKYQNLTPAPLREYIYEINMKRYDGDPLGGSFKFFEKKYMGDYSKIINGAKRPNGDVDKLLKNFKNWLIEKNT